MADSSFSDAQAREYQGVHQYLYVDHSDYYTYKVPVGKEDPDLKNWVLNCTVELKTLVKGDEEDSESGVLANVHFGPLGTFATYIPNGVWSSVADFRTALRRNSKGMPAIFCTLSQPDLQKYGDDRMRAFRNADGTKATKKRVARLGRQLDGKTIVLGPSLVFCEDGGVVQAVEIEDTPYAWIPGDLPEILLGNPSGNSEYLFREIAEPFRGDSVYAFVLTLGGFYMGVHYEKVVDFFNRCPVVICVGDTNCGKSLALAKSANLYGANAASVLEHKSITAAAARDLFQQNMPVLWHDPNVNLIDVLKTLIEENYERKAITTTRDRSVPHTSIMVTCNKDVLRLLLDQIRAISRCVLLPFLMQFCEGSAKQKLDAAGQATCTKDLMEKLLQLTALDLSEIAVAVDDCKEEIELTIKGYGLIESASRIAFNIGLVLGFALKAVDILDIQSVVDIGRLRQFAVKDVAKFAATWQKAPILKRKQCDPPIPLSPAKKVAAAAKEVSLDEMLHGTIIALGCDKVKEVMRITVRADKTQCVAFKKDRAVDILKLNGVDYSFLDNYRTVVDKIPSVKTSVDIRFSGDTTAVKAVTVPVFEISENIVGFVSGNKTIDEYATAAVPNGTKFQPTLAKQNFVESARERTDAEETPEPARAKDSLTAKLNGEISHKAAINDSPTGTPPRFRSPTPPELPSSETEIGAISNASDQHITGEGPSVKSVSRFEPNIVSNSQSTKGSKECGKCGRAYPVTELQCKTCSGCFHRDCQPIQTHHFRGKNAPNFQCIACKEAAKKPKKP